MASDVNRRVSTQDVSWFIDLYKNKQLDFDPPYQRRSVWSPKDRRFFLDTIFRGYPSPSIFLHKNINEAGKTIYAIVDGKQRLETIVRFIENKIAIDKEFGDTRLSGKKWKDIQTEAELARKFWDYVISVEFINVIEGSTYVNEVFDRLNRSARKLVEQELRHAKFDGWFISFVEHESEEPEWVTLGTVTTARTKRMKDVQFLSELLLVTLKGKISGFDQEEISEYYADYDNPVETNPDFDEVDVKTRFATSRNFLVEIEKKNSAVSKYARDSKDFYSLWSLVNLNKDRLPDATVFAEKYAAFMEIVNNFKNELFLKEENTNCYREHYKYYINSIGANTEPPQRIGRHEALITALLG